MKKNEKKVISKGYTIEVTSWENDGDNYNTKHFTVDTIELAKSLYKLCTTVFVSSNNRKGGIGNLSEDSASSAKSIIMKFMIKHPNLYLGEDTPPTDYNEDEDDEDDDENPLVQSCMEWNFRLMGCSEYYYSRVMHKCSVTYSPVDVFLEEITF